MIQNNKTELSICCQLTSYYSGVLKKLACTGCGKSFIPIPTVKQYIEDRELFWLAKNIHCSTEQTEEETREQIEEYCSQTIKSSIEAEREKILEFIEKDIKMWYSGNGNKPIRDSLDDITNYFKELKNNE